MPLAPRKNGFQVFLSLAILFGSSAGCLNFKCSSTDLSCSTGAVIVLFAALQPCNVDYFGAIQTQRGPFYLSTLQSQAALGASGTATVTSFASPILATADKWVGGVLAPNGKIYGIPFGTNNILVIDPATESAATLASPVSGGSKWFGGVLAPNGKLYGIPQTNDNPLLIDPEMNTISTFASSVIGANNKWTGGVLAPDGKIYGIPRQDNNVLIIDSNTNTATTIPSGEASPNPKWAGGVLARNGKIYGIPRDSDNILVIDPKANGAFCDSVLLSGYMNKM